MNKLTKARKAAIEKEIARINEELGSTFYYGPNEIGMKHDLHDLQQKLKVINDEEEKRLQGIS